MAKGDPTFPGMSDMITQSFEQTRNAMEKYLDLFKINMTASPLFTSSDLTKKMQRYGDQNIAIATQYAKKLSQAKDFQDFWQIRPSSCRRNGRRSVNRRRTSVRQLLKVRRAHSKVLLELNYIAVP